jgi:septal ring-binding cell division protein DamX
MLHDDRDGGDRCRRIKGGRVGIPMRLSVLCMVMAGGVIAAAAQSATGSQGTSDATETQKTAAPITVTGCLQRTETASTPATGTAGAPKLPPGFVLINAKSATGESQPADVTTYVLDGSDLAASVGQRVEIKGTLLPAATGTSGKAVPSAGHEAGTVTAETPGAVNSAAAAETPRLHVASSRVVGDCSSTK